MGIDNLWLDKNGRVKLSDPFLSRLRIKQEFTHHRMQVSKQNNQTSLMNPRTIKQSDKKKKKVKGFPQCHRLWQVQNLYFIAVLMNRLATKNVQL